MVSIWQEGEWRRLAAPPGMVETFQGVVSTVQFEERRRGTKEKVLEGEVETRQSGCLSSGTRSRILGSNSERTKHLTSSFYVTPLLLSLLTHSNTPSLASLRAR